MRNRYVVEKGVPHPSDDEEYFFKRSIPEPNSGCWIWQGTLSAKGYGVYTANKKQRGAHRGSYEAGFGHIPEGMYVCHKCDVRCCVNPDHLFVGSHADNMKDMAIKLRQNRKLTGEQVLEIKSSNLSGRELAKKFGVKPHAIYGIRQGKRWKYI